MLLLTRLTAVPQDDFNPLDEIDSDEEHWHGNASDDGSDFMDYSVLHSPLRNAPIRSESLAWTPATTLASPASRRACMSSMQPDCSG